MLAGEKTTSVVVFLPGTLCNAEVFAPQIEVLKANDVNCIVIDFGDANSLKGMVEKLIHQVRNAGFQNVTLVAFSMGAMVAFELLRHTALYTFTIEQLILISSNAHADDATKTEARKGHLAIAKTASLNELMSLTYMPNYLYKDNKAYQKIIVGMAETLGIKVFSSQLKVLAQRPDSTNVLKALTIPCCIIAGQQDLLCLPSEQLRMAQAAQLSEQPVELVLLDDCGHFATLEQAQHINQLLLKRISTQH
ncbi:MAG: pimeloyl-ACP methyl ester carboxylesterase [Alphaproteobacteria bacterium]|jgi:pimeloyl-ACP methyl ester carboxylesterase